MENEGIRTRLRVAALVTPGMGHLIPIAELAKLLVAAGDFSITLITFAESSSPTQKSLLQSLTTTTSTITSVELPPVPLDDLPSAVRIETRISVAVSRSVPAVRDVLRDLRRSDNLAAFVADIFGADGFDAAREAGVPCYLFFPSNLQALLLMLHLPELDASTSCEFRDLPAPVELPGCVPISGTDMAESQKDRSDDAHRWILHHSRRYLEANCILVNSFDELEPAGRKQLHGFRPPVYMVGPLVRAGDIDGGSLMITEWLDRQPGESVLFVCFGSGGVLSTEQTEELALGLEMSGQRFLWVVRRPSSGSGYFANAAAGDDDPVGFLPEGFVERTKEMGMVVTNWAPQPAVLEHDATGGFLSHCGWNSALESLASGVPMIAWPLFAEQRINAVVLDVGAGVAIRPAAAAGGVYGREEIARVVKELMEGEGGKKARGKAKELRRGGASAMDDGGPSRAALKEVMDTWRSAAADACPSD